MYTGSWSVETLHHRNAEMRKTPFGVGFGYRELECRNSSPQKLQNAEMQNCDMEFSGIATWSFRNSQHAKSRNAERNYCESQRLEGKNVEIMSVVRLGK
jgi:hypothetical protein